MRMKQTNLSKFAGWPAFLLSMFIGAAFVCLPLWAFKAYWLITSVAVLLFLGQIEMDARQKEYRK